MGGWVWGGLENSKVFFFFFFEPLPNYFRQYLNCFNQTDEELIKMLQTSEYNLSPPPTNKKYNFRSNMVSYGQFSQSLFLDMVVFKGIGLGIINFF